MSKLRLATDGAAYSHIAAACLALYLGGIAFLALAPSPRPSQLAVVFGNAVRTNGTPSPRLQARLDAALAVYRAGLAPRIMVSGGMEQNGTDEAASVRAYLIAHGVPAAAITQDPRGATTYATACNTAALLQGGSVILVTQWFHIPRAMLAMYRFGLTKVSAVYPHYFEPRDIFSFVREAVAVPFYAVRAVKPVNNCLH